MKNKTVIPIAIKDCIQKVNSRITYNPDELAELMTSLRQRGLLMAIGVRKIPGGKYEVVFGNRRFMAAKKLDWDVIDAHVVEADTDESVLLLNAIENMQRAEVPIAEQGRVFSALRESGLTSSQIAAKIGKPSAIVTKILKLWDRIPPELRPRIKSAQGGIRLPGEISQASASIASDIGTRLALSKEKQKELLEFGARPDISAGILRKISQLVSTGIPLEEAKRKLESTRIINIIVALDKKVADRLEQEHKKSIHQIIEEHLQSQTWLGGVGVVGRHKKFR